MKTSLYRLFDANDQLLYVGVSYSPMRRFGQHRHTDKRIEHVARAEFQWFDTRAEAEAAESIAIEQEQPLWNKTLTGRSICRWPRRERKPVPEFNRPWRCLAVGEGLHGPYDCMLPAEKAGLALEIVRRGDRVSFGTDMDVTTAMIEAIPGVHLYWVRDQVKKATGTPRRNVK